MPKSFQDIMERAYTNAAEKLAVLPGMSEQQAERLGQLLADAFPIGPLRPPWTTKEKFNEELRKMNAARAELRRLSEERLGIKLP